MRVWDESRHTYHRPVPWVWSYMPQLDKAHLGAGSTSDGVRHRRRATDVNPSPRQGRFSLSLLRAPRFRVRRRSAQPSVAARPSDRPIPSRSRAVMQLTRPGGALGSDVRRVSSADLRRSR